MTKINVPFTVLAIVGVLAPAVGLFILLVAGEGLTPVLAAISNLLILAGIIFVAGALVVAGVNRDRA